MNYFPCFLKQVISSQDQQNKPWMMWLNAEMYRVWGDCRTRDAKNIWPNSICCVPQWPYLPDSFGHLGVGRLWQLGPRRCRIEVPWPHDDAGGIQRLQGSNDLCGKFRWLSIYASATLNAIGLLDERETSVSYVFAAGWQPKKIKESWKKKWRWLGTSKSDVLETRGYVLKTFVQ